MSDSDHITRLVTDYDQLLPLDLTIKAAVVANFAYHAALRDDLMPRKPAREQRR